MKGAIEEFRTGNKSLRFIARAWNVPLTILQRRVKGKIQGHKYSLGKSTMLNEQQEAELCLCIKTMSSRGFPMTKSNIQSLAMQFINANNIKGFNREKEKCGYYWFKRFMARHPDLSCKKSESISVAWAMGMSKPRVEYWFLSYRNLLEKYVAVDIDLLMYGM